MVDFSFLANPTALQLPDPTAMAIRGQTLANLTQQNQEGQAKLDAIRRAQEGQDALAQVLPALQAAGYSKEAIQQALQAQPKAAPFLLDYLDKKRKGDQDYEKTGAEIQDKKADANKKDMDRTSEVADKFGNEAAWLADHPKLTPDMVADYQKRVAGAGLQDVLRTVPFEDWTDPNKARDALKANAMQFYDIKDRIVNQETGRHNLATEGIQRDQNTETAGYHKASLAQQWGIANMQDQRARDLNKITAEGNQTKQVQNNEMKMADDYRTQSKAFQETAAAMRKAKAALADADTNPGSALAAGTAFMKLLDPNSVVRESELGMALNASGWMDRATNIVNTLNSGKVMTPQQKANLGKAMDDLYSEASNIQRQLDMQYSARISRYGGDPRNVVMEMGQNSAPVPTAGVAKPSTAALATAPKGSGADYVYVPGKK